MTRSKYDILNEATEIIGLDDILIPGSLEHNIVTKRLTSQLEELGPDKFLEMVKQKQVPMRNNARVLQDFQ